MKFKIADKKATFKNSTHLW